MFPTRHDLVALISNENVVVVVVVVFEFEEVCMDWFPVVVSRSKNNNGVMTCHLTLIEIKNEKMNLFLFFL